MHKPSLVNIVRKNLGVTIVVILALGLTVSIALVLSAVVSESTEPSPYMSEDVQYFPPGPYRIGSPDVLHIEARSQAMTGDYLVAPDGTINLRQYGSVQVGGKTVAEAKAAVDNHLAEFLESPDVVVEVVGFNSKVYYIVAHGKELGDKVIRVPLTGDETVLDAVAQVGSGETVWLIRRAPDNCSDVILPVDFDAIVQGGSTATNYQILSGDRVFVIEENEGVVTGLINKVGNFLQRLLGDS